MSNIEIKTTDSLETVAQALAEGEHNLGNEATAAGSLLLGWAGNDCPWFVPHPEHLGGKVEIASFDGLDVERF